MAHYFLQIRHGARFTEDPEGADFLNLEAARTEALGVARDLLSSAVLQGHLPLKHSVEIADDTGRVLLTVPFREAVREPS